jgi:hypothetical protein
VEGYESLVRSVMGLDPPLFIFGGFAEDVLLNGRVARPHSDLDVLMYREEIDQRLEQFATLGFTAWEVWYMPRPGLPLVYHAASDGIDLEPSVFERDEIGCHFVLEDLTGTLNRVYLPDDAFAYPPIPLNGIDYRILSPLSLYQIRAAIESLGVFGPLRVKDIEVQQRLRSRFLSDRGESDLSPRIEPL